MQALLPTHTERERAMELLDRLQAAGWQPGASLQA